ncbi:hypothetical protein AK973_5479 [Pseudomonas brassicacearum]|nr:hypothetical protein AK973_5479 [Pseudomonas brassicacearum]
MATQMVAVHFLLFSPKVAACWSNCRTWPLWEQGLPAMNDDAQVS